VPGNALKNVKASPTDPATLLTEKSPVPWAQPEQLTYIAEQVSHHPPSKKYIHSFTRFTRLISKLILASFPVTAFYAEHPMKKVSANAHIWTKSKFLGLSIAVHMVGQGVVSLHEHDEEYIVTFPSGYGR
jgi:hypothetical protein